MSHAMFSPSSANRWLVCDLAAQMNQLFISHDTAASSLGTERHGCAAMHLENDTEPKDKHLKIYTNAVRQAAVDGELFVEEKVVIVPDYCEGTADATVVAADWFKVFDLKYGKSPVSATDNPQLKIYGVGFVMRHDLPPDMPGDLVIVQPRASTGWPVKTWGTTAGDLLEFKNEVVEPAIERGLKPNPKGTAGRHCFWCPGKLHCQAYLTRGGK